MLQNCNSFDASVKYVAVLELCCVFLLVPEVYA